MAFLMLLINTIGSQQELTIKSIFFNMHYQTLVQEKRNKWMIDWIYIDFLVFHELIYECDTRENH